MLGRPCRISPTNLAGLTLSGVRIIGENIITADHNRHKTKQPFVQICPFAWATANSIHIAVFKLKCNRGTTRTKVNTTGRQGDSRFSIVSDNVCSVRVFECPNYNNAWVCRSDDKRESATSDDIAVDTCLTPRCCPRWILWTSHTHRRLGNARLTSVWLKSNPYLSPRV